MDDAADEVAAADRFDVAQHGHRPRSREVEASVRPSVVVMPDVLGEDPFEAASGEHEQMVQAAFRTARTQRSVNAFAFGERTGVRTVAAPIEAKTLSKLAVNLGVVSRIGGSGHPSNAGVLLAE